MPDWISTYRERKFPKLDRSLYRKTSDENDRNNCFGFAAGDTGWWQPPLEPWHYWPQGAPLDFSVNSFVRAYEIEGFSVCNNTAQEAGYEKVAIYGYPDGEFAHAAKLNDDDSWTSKLGDWEDIRHAALENLEGDRPAYGYVRVFMRRSLRS